MVDEGQLLGALSSCVTLTKQFKRDTIDEKIRELKQGDGESWAIGETIERIMILRGMLDDPSILEELAKKWESGR